MEKIHDFTAVRQLWGDVATKIDNNFAELAGKTGMLADLGKVASDEEAFSQAAVLAGNTGVCLICWHTDIESGYILQSAITPSVVMQLRLATDANGTSYMRKVQNGEASGWTEWPAGGVDEPSVEADADTVTLKNGADALYELAGASEEKAGIVTADDYSRMLNTQVVEMGDVPDEEGLIEKIKILCEYSTPRIVVYERGKGDKTTYYQGWLMLFNNVSGIKKHVVCFEASGNDTSYKNFSVYNFKWNENWEYVNKFELGDGAVAQEALEAANSAQQTAETAKSTADTAKQTAEGAKASAEGLTGEVTELGQQLDEVAADATGATDGLQQFMTQGILTQAPFPRATAAASGSFAAVGGDAPLKDGEIIPWTGWLTLVLCYTTTDSAAKVKLTGYAGPTLGKCELIGETAVAASEEPRVVRITGEHDYNPKRNGAPDACMDGSSYHVNVEVKSPNAGFTMLWAVVYESDEYGNPRRRGGSLREQIEGTLQSCPALALGRGTTTATVYNEKTGWFEVNGLVDMTFDDCLLVLNDFPAKTAINSLNNDFISHARTNNALQGIYNSGVNFNFYNDGGETLALGPQLRSSMSGFLNQNNNNNLIAILSYIRFQGANISAGSSLFCEKLESLAIKNISGSYSFAKNPSLSWDTWKYLIDNAAEGISEEGITVTVHADVYAKMTGGTVDDWGSLGTLASEKGVKLVSFGESGYPFLTRVLWHGYKRLENKINAATSGDIIYIHPDDRQKISAAQQDNWGTLVTLAAEKNITFAQAE